MPFPHIVSKRFLSSAASVLASTVCIVPLILGSTVARAQEGSMLGAGEIVVLAQTRETSPTQKDPMSWKDILGKAGPPVPAPSQEPSSRQPSVSVFILPKLSGRVVDEANLLDQATRVVLTNKLAHLEAKTSHHVVVVTLRSLQGASIEDFGLELGQYWQFGQSHGSHDVLLIVAPNERKVDILVGHRLQSRLTNTIATLIENKIVPRINQNDFAGGISSAVDDIIHILMPNSPESVGQSHGPSFDCKSAKNPNEKLICQSTELAELDRNMADLVTSVMDRLNNTDRKELQKSQRSWLRERLDCGDDFTCTKEAYDERIKHLKSVVAKLSPNPPPSTKTDQLSKGDRLRVANIGPNDVLTMREYPTANSRVIDGIPPKNEEIIYLGEEHGEWIFVRYGNRAEGWVNRHFVEPIIIIPPGRRLQ
jgi:uncharacterized protein YecT (DUF1311 family)